MSLNYFIVGDLGGTAGCSCSATFKCRQGQDAGASVKKRGERADKHSPHRRQFPISGVKLTLLSSAESSVDPSMARRLRRKTQGNKRSIEKTKRTRGTKKIEAGWLFLQQSV